MPSSAWGIDIGNCSLKAIKLVGDGDEMRVDDFEVIEHGSILTEAGDSRDSLVHHALAAFAQRHPTGRLPIGVGVSAQNAFARFVKLPPAPAKLSEIVRFEAIQQIPFPLDDVEWSYELFRDAAGVAFEVGILAMRKELVNKQISYFADLGMNINVVQLNPLAIYNAMLFLGNRMSGTTLLMDVGAGHTDVVIGDVTTLWVRTIPLGGNSFTQSLVKQFKLTFAKAEELKRNAATSRYAKQIFQAMRPVYADLVSEVQRSIGFYTSVHRDARLERIVSLGSTFRLAGLQKFLQQNLQLPVEQLDAFGAGRPADARAAAVLQENMLSLAPAYGLALQAKGVTAITANLLPERLKRRARWACASPLGAVEWFVRGLRSAASLTDRN